MARHDVLNRLLIFDPSPVYKSIRINRFSRNQKYFHTQECFPTLFPLCSCGCGMELTGKQRRWATQDCHLLSYYVFCVIAGRTEVIRQAIELRDGHVCRNCGVDTCLQVDHILPVFKGGGACWLDNYQFLCVSCHKIKTKKDLEVANG